MTPIFEELRGLSFNLKRYLSDIPRFYKTWKEGRDLYVVKDFRDIRSLFRDYLGDETGNDGPGYPEEMSRLYWMTKEGKITIYPKEIGNEEVTVIKGLGEEFLSKVPDLEDLDEDPYDSESNEVLKAGSDMTLISFEDLRAFFEKLGKKYKTRHRDGDMSYYIDTADNLVKLASTMIGKPLKELRRPRYFWGVKESGEYFGLRDYTTNWRNPYWEVEFYSFDEGLIFRNSKIMKVVRDALGRTAKKSSKGLNIEEVAKYIASKIYDAVIVDGDVLYSSFFASSLVDEVIDHFGEADNFKGSSYYWNLSNGSQLELKKVPDGMLISGVTEELSKYASLKSPRVPFSPGDLKEFIKSHSQDSWKENGNLYIVEDFTDVWDELLEVLGEEDGYNDPDRPYWETEGGRVSITYENIDDEEVTIIRGLKSSLLRQIPDRDSYSPK